MTLSQPTPVPAATSGPTVLVERPPPGLARGPLEGSSTLVLALGLTFATIGLMYIVWRVFRWNRHRSPPPTQS